MALTKAHNRMIEGSAVNVLDFGAVGDGVTDDTAAIQAAFTYGESVYFPNGSYLFSTSLTCSSSNISIQGDGVLVATNGADITLSGDNVLFDIKVTGNTIQSATVTAKTTSPDTITVDGSLTYNIGDQLLIKSTDSFNRVIWVGTISNVAGNTLTVTTNTIDGLFADVATSQVVYVIASETYHGEVRFDGCDNPKVGSRFSGSSRDLSFYNCNNVVHGELSLTNANLLYQFCYETNAGGVVSHNSRYYGRTIQGCSKGTWGNLIAESPLFSGQVIKGLHDGDVGSIYVSNAPVMSIQCVNYPGSTPNTINPNCQSDLLNSNVRWGNVQIDNGNWIASVKSSDVMRFGSIVVNKAYKAFYGDAGWTEIEIDDFICTNHNAGGTARTTNASAALWIDGGTRFVIKNRCRIKGSDTSSTNGFVYINNVTDRVYISELDIEANESFIRIDSCNNLLIDSFKSIDSVDGFQILRLSSINVGTINKIVVNESTNSNLDRFVYIASGNNLKFNEFDITYDGASITPTDGIRSVSGGDHLYISGGVVRTLNSATCSNVVRIAGATTATYVNIRDCVSDGATNVVNSSGIADYFTVIGCSGTINDTTGALTHKDVATGNI